MLAAIVKVSGVMDDEAFLAEMQKSYAYKFASKPEVIEGSLPCFTGGTIMVSDINKLGLDVKWQDLTPGCTIIGSCTAEVFRTGEWRVDTPKFIEEKCKQCLLCVPVCPDSSIPVKEGKRLDFDLDHCKGCGICEKACPFDAIIMKKGGGKITMSFS